MPLSVVGTGIGRTGTLSLKMALEQLGFGPCFHCLDGPSSLIERVIRLALDRQPLDWEGIFAGYNAAVDVPVSWFYEDILEKCISAKFILTVREPEAWYDSAQALRAFLATVVSIKKTDWETRRKQLATVVSPEVLELIEFTSHKSVIAAFERFNAGVKRNISANRLLVFDVKQGWQPLCTFLGVSMPDTPFPRVNHREEFTSRVQHMIVRADTTQRAP